MDTVLSETIISYVRVDFDEIRNTLKGVTLTVSVVLGKNIIEVKA